MLSVFLSLDVCIEGRIGIQNDGFVFGFRGCHSSPWLAGSHYRWTVEVGSDFDSLVQAPSRVTSDSFYCAASTSLLGFTHALLCSGLCVL